MHLWTQQVYGSHGIAHERLAIIDPDSGSQPLVSPDGNGTSNMMMMTMMMMMYDKYDEYRRLLYSHRSCQWWDL